jgi:3-oxoacyl-[acyl-carrier-protein] synthase-1
MRPVYLHGRALVSALGADLPQALACISAGGSAAPRVALADGTDWPFFAIDHPEPDWRKRARQIIGEAFHEAGIKGDRDAPLFVASSSLDIGAIETGVLRTGDGYDFAEKIADQLGWTGPVYLVNSACTSSLQALLSASRLISSGSVNDAVVLGVELANRYSVSGFAAMQLLTPDKPKPLGLNRDGIALGEAVSVLHLSSRPGRWRLCGGSNIVDGRDPTGAISQTVTRMCEQALAASGLKSSDIDLIKLQAAGSPVNDVNELAGLAAAFESLPPLVTFKAAIGHTLGASGAAEIALLTACLETNVWPYPDYPLDPYLHAGLAYAKPKSVRYVLADILGFGGGHSAVILEDTNVR